MPRPVERRWAVEFYSLLPERDVSAFEHDPQNDVTERGRESRADQRCETRIGAHQLRNDEAGDQSGDGAANRDLVGNNEMLEIDKGRDEQNGNEDPIGNGDLPGKKLPDREKQKRGQQFDAEIAKGNFVSAFCATAAQKQPADDRNILLPRNLGFTDGAKRTTRFFDRDIARQSINADVQKRTNGRAGKERDHREKCDVKGNIHAIRSKFSTFGVPSSTRSRCSFRKGATLAAPLRSE